MYGAHGVADVRRGTVLANGIFETEGAARSAALKRHDQVAIGIFRASNGWYELDHLEVRNTIGMKPATPDVSWRGLTSESRDNFGFDQIAQSVRLLDPALTGIVTKGTLITR